MDEPTYKLGEIEGLLALADEFLSGCSDSDTHTFLGGLGTMLGADCAGLLELEHESPEFIVGFVAIGGSTRQPADITQDFHSIRASGVLASGVHLSASGDTLISIIPTGSKIVSAIAINRPRKSFGSKASTSLRMIHRLVQSRLARMQDRATFIDKASPRLREVYQALLDGLSNKQIAIRLQIRPSTVHVYVKNLFKLRGVNSRSELLIKAFRSDYVSENGHPRLARHDHRILS